MMVGFGDVKLAEFAAQKAPAPDQAAIAKLSVEERVKRLAADAQKKYNCTVKINQSDRTAEQAQQFHVCHMFLYNMFKHLRPKHTADDGKTIDWLHLADPKVKWVLIGDPTAFLRTANGEPARRDESDAWAKGFEPDRSASIKAMATFLKNHHVSSMAAPGINGCGDPCGCGGMASKHITGAACDVSGMKELAAVLAKQNGGKGIALDDYLKSYGLHRPMAHLEGKRREEWHVEKLPRVRPPRRAASAKDGAGHPLAKHAGKEGMLIPGKAGSRNVR